MDEMGLASRGAPNQASQNAGRLPFTVSPVFVFIPVGGLLAAMAAISSYRPVDRWPILWPSLGVFFAAVILISHVRQKAIRGEDISSFFPVTYWLAFAPAILGLGLWMNGALDHSPPDSHQQVVTRKFVSHGRHGTSYWVEITSWRPQRSTEKLSVPYRQYVQLQVNDPIIVDLHRGALGIPWIGAVRNAD
jgi:hypothetical protein